VSDEFRPVLMWFWNSAIDPDEARRQVGEFRAQGVRDFFVHAAYGLETEYLSAEFMRLVRVAAGEAKRLGMRFWIYDEYAWPSGTAGGMVLRGRPQDRMRLLLCGEFAVPAGQSVRFADVGDPVAATAVLGDGRAVSIELDGCSWLNPWQEPCRLFVFRHAMSGGVHPSGKWSAHSWGQEGSLDGCSPGAVRHFLDLTHERYAQAIGADFGAAVPGVFMDEPVMCTGWVLDHPDPFTGIPWHAGMLEAFFEEYGYDLRSRLHELTLCVGDWRRTRRDYWRHLALRFGGSFIRQVADWCEGHGLKLTGHINAEEGLGTSLLCSGDFYEALRWYHIPGCDSIAATKWLNVDETVLPPKMASSVAHMNGRPRALCEAFTGSGWDLSLREMRRVADRLAVLGVNMLQLMGAYYSVKGFRKNPPDASWPPSHSFQNALWSHYHLFSEYVARVQERCSRGVHLPACGLLYPVSTAMAEYRIGHLGLTERDAHYARTWALFEGSFIGAARALLETQHDYDIVFEQALLDAEVGDSCLRMAGEMFPAIMLAGCTVLRAGIMEKLRDFVAAGGILVFLNAAPEWLDDGSCLRSTVMAGFGFDPQGLNSAALRALELGDSVAVHAQPAPGVHTIVTAGTGPGEREPLRAALRDALRAVPGPVISPPEPSVWVQVRHVGGGIQACLLNTAAEPWEGSVSLGKEGHIIAESPDLGTADAVPVKMRDDGRAWGPVRLGPHELVFLTRAPHPAPMAECHGDMPEHILQVPDQWLMEPLGGNLLPLSLSACAVGGAGASCIERAAEMPRGDFAPTADGRFLEGVEPVHGTGNGWGVMCGSWPLTSFPPGSEWWVRSEFFAEDAPDDLELIVEDLGVRGGLVNGRRCGDFTRCVAWDSENLRATVAHLVNPGLNTLILRVVIPAWDGPHALPMVALRGHFEVSADGALASPGGVRTGGDWRDHGYPRFSGTMRYRAKIDVPAGAVVARRAELHVAEVAEAVTLFVNGGKAGERAWPPYRFNVAGILAVGQNNIELRVASTSANLFGDGAPSGLLGGVQIHWGP
jgi:hypothetical protein